VQANKLLAKAQRLAQKILIPALDPSIKLAVVCWTDASWANRVDHSSPGGFLIGLAPSEIQNGNNSMVTPLYWATQKLKRQARSSLSAEAQALANAEQELYYARLAWYKVGLGLWLDPLAPLESILQVPGMIVIDADFIYDAMHGAPGPLELDISGWRPNDLQI